MLKKSVDFNSNSLLNTQSSSDRRKLLLGFTAHATADGTRDVLGRIYLFILQGNTHTYYILINNEIKDLKNEFRGLR